MSSEITPAQQSRSVVAAGEVGASALASQARAAIEARYVVALQRTRDLDVVRERLLRECKRPGFAEVARYLKPIGNGVEGPSIRFAEAAIRCMGNMAVDTITQYDDREKRIILVTVTDIENNNSYSQPVTVPKSVERKHPKQGDVILRQRTNSYGQQVSLIEATDDDILNVQNSLISKAVRTLALRHVPGDLVDEAMTLILETLKTKDAEDPDAAKRRIFDAFAEVGVTAQQLKTFIGESETLQPAQMKTLRGLYAAIRDGETTWTAIMDAKKDQGEPKVGETKTSAVAAKLKQKAQAQTQAKPPQQEAAEPTPEEIEAIRKAEMGGQV